jgi:hypothetical protein
VYNFSVELKNKCKRIEELKIQKVYATSSEALENEWHPLASYSVINIQVLLSPSLK